MDSVTVAPKRRGRKRKIIDVHDGPVECDAKKALRTIPLKLVGRYVLKEFRGSGMFLGKIVSYDSGLYRINYEDGDCEDLNSSELKTFLIGEDDLFGIWHGKKEKLDNLLHKNLDSEVLEIGVLEKSESVDQVHASSFNGLKNGETVAYDVGNILFDADLSSDSCDDAQEQDFNLDMEVPLVPLPDLPPSSGHIGVPEEYVSHLLSVYAFLRSFSVPLFLYPFGLDEFVGALNCTVANTLLDSIHVAFMHVLHRHFERLSPEGSELALKCLRCLDWSLLDAITWPVYVVNYLVVMGYTNGPEWKGFYSHSLERDYYTLSAGRKLIVLQILCDDVLDSEELTAEMQVREESEIGIDVDNTVVCASICGPRRVHPRYSKTSASKDREGMKGFVNNREMKPSFSHSMAFQAVEPLEGSPGEDGNGDECRLCGMDGFLLCCDGCPSSYHSRCLGLNKMYMPEGSWYCPECKINATEPKILQGTELRGGHICGVDPYEQVFVAACDHLVVLKASANIGNCLRYYNKNDIPRVLHTLCSKAEHAIMYSEICRKIVQCWKLQGIILPHNEIHETSLQSADKEVACITEIDYIGICDSGTRAVEIVTSNHLDVVQKSEFSCNILHTVTEYDQRKVTEPVLSTNLIVHASDHSELSQPSTSNVPEAVKNTCGNDYWPVGGHSLMDKVSVPCPGLINIIDENAHERRNYGCLYAGSSFKISDYINYYLHGDFAAAAAAQLAVLSSEENQVSELRASCNRKKGLTDSVSLQLKAFSMVAMRFVWPNTEKKLVEVPRERCSWCFSCKASVSSRRGCLLNAAASNITRGANKPLAGVRPPKNGDGRLSGLSTYIMYIEENLRGLVVGPFLNDIFRMRWRKQVEQASTCNSMKILLLELEENIRRIGLSEDWMKLVDGGSSQHPTSQGAASATGSTQKRKPGRRGRKPSTVVKIVVDDAQDESTDFTWWRGGSLSKLLLQRGILPCSMIRKTARQGGSKKIPRIHYLEGQETPKITRQLVWQAATEMSRSIAQLAHQVRCLDFHVRWGDLIRPEQVTYDGKGPETEASAFRNAFVCDKKIVANEIRYCVAFGKQKHLPSRLMKNITEIEKILDDGKERYWFSESRIPLYLIKEYEEKAERDKSVDILSKLQKRQLKALRKSIFSYLYLKRDNMEKDYCCSCNQDLLYRNAVQCTACQGFCHERCTSSLTVHVKEEVEFLITCKQCCNARRGPKVQSINASPTSPLLLQGQDFSNAAITKSGKLGHKGPSGTVKPLEHSSDMKPVNRSLSANKNKIKNWGLIWSKKNGEETGIDFRLKNILLRGNPDVNLIKPSCRLCNESYNADLMYIRCETCQYWFHADAVELDESKIFGLVGFKCCKCRRIRSPVCPYSEKKKALEDKIELRDASKQEISGVESDYDVISEHYREEAPTFFEVPMKSETSHVAGDDTHFHSCEVEQYTEEKLQVAYGWNNSTVSMTGPQKLPVRRHVRQEKDTENLHPSPFEAKVTNSKEKLAFRRHNMQEHETERNNHVADMTSCLQESLTTQVDWVISNENFDDGVTLDYDCLGCDDMEFEPQTYFSFNELLASDDVGRVNGKESFECAAPSSIPEDGALEVSYNHEELTLCVDTDIHLGPCKICSHTQPYPDLSCQICGMWIHSHCSPWVEPSSWEDGWKCGHCRNWR